LGEDVPDFFVGVLSEGVEVLSDRSLDQEWRLWDVPDILSEQVQTDTGYIPPINQNLPFMCIYQPEKNLEDGALTCACPSYDAYFHSRLDSESQV